MAIDWSARVEQLEDMIAGGVLRATYEGHTLEYRSMSELRQALSYAKGKAAGYSASRPRAAFTAARGVVGE